MKSVGKFLIFILMCGVISDIVSMEEQPSGSKKLSNERRGARRSRSFSFTKPARRSSTGQLGVIHREMETHTVYSPRLRRENSKGSIEITPEKWLILASWKKKQDKAQEIIEKQQD